MPIICKDCGKKMRINEPIARCACKMIVVGPNGELYKVSANPLDYVVQETPIGIFVSEPFEETHHV